MGWSNTHRAVCYKRHLVSRLIIVWLLYLFFFSSRRRHTRFDCDWSSDVCSSDLVERWVSVGSLAYLKSSALLKKISGKEGGLAPAGWFLLLFDMGTTQRGKPTFLDRKSVV